MNSIKHFIAEEDGVTAIEYGLIAALIGVAIAVGASALGGKISDLFKSIGDKIAAPK
ncbi:Flp family type IVb pilin [Janthinobacterium fluminis]|uniref:Flp family type IVb pilin n=1 Tax=Janthinobacterium fluminis TaxID=2987524 RepID=A0ABT5JZ73_9BURK|nr:Flp family type IVb pilin [Janthinobacterium fluminis]MDC8758030.1 Flp family type IVb pilin [Janthinobacterium fluminis]